jgi:hypothetical protein
LRGHAERRAVCVWKDLNANNLPDVIFGHELPLRGERNSSGHAKDKGDRLFNRDEVFRHGPAPQI